MKIIGKRMAIKLNEEIAEEQAGFHSGKGTRDQIMNLKMTMEKIKKEELLCSFVSLTMPRLSTRLRMTSCGML